LGVPADDLGRTVGGGKGAGARPSAGIRSRGAESCIEAAQAVAQAVALRAEVLRGVGEPSPGGVASGIALGGAVERRERACGVVGGGASALERGIGPARRIVARD